MYFKNFWLEPPLKVLGYYITHVQTVLKIVSSLNIFIKKKYSLFFTVTVVYKIHSSWIYISRGSSIHQAQGNIEEKSVAPQMTRFQQLKASLPFALIRVAWARGIQCESARMKLIKIRDGHFGLIWGLIQVQFDLIYLDLRKLQSKSTQISLIWIVFGFDLVLVRVCVWLSLV